MRNLHDSKDHSVVLSAWSTLNLCDELHITCIVWTPYNDTTTLV